jgi:hypothetical protein
MNKRLMTSALGVLALSVGVAACGDDADETTGDGAAGAASETLTGTFEPVQDAPGGADGIEGTAEMTVGDDGTKAMIELTGLEPETEYVSHVHAAGCDQPDPGGPHFMFDLNGEEMPPNEIHLPFTSDADGGGSAEASNEQAVPDPATRSIVVHLADDSMGSESASEMNMEDSGHSDMEHGSTDKDKDSEHGADDGHTGHTHSPKLVCADLS